jgi:hypothetical protein
MLSLQRVGMATQMLHSGHWQEDSVQDIRLAFQLSWPLYNDLHDRICSGEISQFEDSDSNTYRDDERLAGDRSID